MSYEFSGQKFLRGGYCHKLMQLWQWWWTGSVNRREWQATWEKEQEQLMDIGRGLVLLIGTNRQEVYK